MFRLIVAIFLLFPALANSQDVWQLISAQEYHQMKSGPEKTARIRKLERNGWYHQGNSFDFRGKPVESPRIDLGPFVDNMGETVFLVTDIAPEFPGGQASLEDYLQNALADLLTTPGESVQNSARIKFSVEKDGSITEVEAGENAEWIPSEVIQRCKNALQEMPKWSPGIYKDRPMKVKMMMSFSLRQ